VLDVGVRLALDDLFDLETRRRQIARHLGRLEEKEVNVHLLIAPFVEVNRIVADVKRQQQEAARLEHSTQLAERLHHFVAWNVDDRVKGGDARPGSRRRRPPSAGHHRPRQGPQMLGMRIVGARDQDEVCMIQDYAGPGEHRVVFEMAVR
jgi:hypothetical protein